MTHRGAPVAFSWCAPLLFLVLTATVVHAKCPADRDDHFHCNDPDLILRDPSIQCDKNTCLWRLDLLDKRKQPMICEAVQIVPTRVETLPDYLEPCLWWEMLHGDLGYLLPSLPTTEPTLAPSVFPTLEPTAEPTALPSTEEPTEEPTAEDTTASPTGEPTELPEEEEDETEEPSSPLVVQDDEEEATEVPEEVAVTAEPLEGTDEPADEEEATPEIEPTPAVSVPAQLERLLVTIVLDNSRFLRRHLAVLDGPAHDILVPILNEHVKKEIDQVTDADIYVQPVVKQSTPTNNGMLALSGTVWFRTEAGQTLDLTPQAVRAAVSTAFEGPPVDRLVEQLKETDSPYWNRLSFITTDTEGLPQGGTLRTKSDSSTPFYEKAWDKTYHFVEEYDYKDPLWLTVLVAACAFMVGLCLVCVVCCCERVRCCRRRNRSSKRYRSGSDFSDNAVLAQDPTSEDRGSDEGMGARAAEEDGASLVYGGSEVTSVYSYIDTHTLGDDPSINTASIMYQEGVDTEDANRSVLWSVMDGITSDMSIPRPHSSSPSRMVVTAGKAQDVMIFSDEDDDELSVVSDRAMQPKAMNFSGAIAEPPVAEKCLERVVFPHNDVDLVEPESSPRVPGDLTDKMLSHLPEEALIDEVSYNVPLSNLSLVEEASTKAEEESQTMQTASEGHLRDDDSLLSGMSGPRAKVVTGGPDDDDEEEGSSLFMEPVQATRQNTMELSPKDKVTGREDGYLSDLAAGLAKIKPQEVPKEDKENGYGVISKGKGRVSVVTLEDDDESGSLSSYLDSKRKYCPYGDDGSLISKTFTEEERDCLGLNETNTSYLPDKHFT